MPRVESEAVINLSQQALWELMRDTELRPRWDASVRRVVRSVSGPDDRTERLYYVAPLFLGLTWRWEGEYISFQGPHTSAVRMVKGSLLCPFSTLVGTWLLRDEGEGTRLKLIVSFEPRIRFPLWRRAMTRRLRRILSQTLRDLQRLSVQLSPTTTGRG